jgi:D-sedoheptulose 7-phosphate isomerase
MQPMHQNLLAQFQEHIRLSELFLNQSNLNAINSATKILAHTIKSGGKILTCGNGGSMCDAMHMAEELSGRYRKNRPPLPAFSVSDPSYVTCTANDFGFEYIFSRYVEAFLNKDDVLVAFSTSGNSRNVINAAIAAQKLKAKVVALTGNDGGILKNHADIEIRVPYFGYADRIQEIHILVIHALIAGVENILFPDIVHDNAPA